MLFFELAGLGVLVAEDKVDLVGLAAFVGAEHDGVRGLVRELVWGDACFCCREELDVSTAASETLLQLDLVLDDEGLALGVDGRVKEVGDGVLLGLGLEHETGVAGEAGEDLGLLYGPDAVVLEGLGVVLLLELGGLGGLPSFGPIRGELLDEGSLDGCGGELWPGGIGGGDLCEDEGGEGGCDGGLHCGDGDDGSSGSSSNNRVW